MKTGGKSILAAAAIAALASSAGAASMATRFVFRGYGKFANDCTSRSTRRYPQMVVNHGEIAEWNRNVKTRQVLRHQARHA